MNKTRIAHRRTLYHAFRAQCGSPRFSLSQLHIAFFVFDDDLNAPVFLAPFGRVI